MALIGRLAILGGAAAAAAWFLKQRQESEQASYGADAPTRESAEAVVGEPERVGDAAAAGTGTAEPAEAPVAAEPAEPAGTSEPTEEPAGATRVSEVVEADTGSDPHVRQQEQAAAAQAGSIGGSPETTQSSEDPAREPVDPAMKPVVEAAGEDHETLVEEDAARGAGREREGTDKPAE